jgi:O-antigen/teichoic acid export membrane protein
MRSRLVWRRSATALGIYASTLLGIAGTVVAARQLGVHDFGRFGEVLAVASFFHLLLDLTSEEALVKYGFRYSVREEWSRFRRLITLTIGLKTASASVSSLIVLALAPFADRLFGTEGLLAPMLVAAALPLLQSTEGLGASLLLLRSRYDLRAALLMFGMAARLVAIVAAAPHGLLAVVIAITLAQAVSTAAVTAVGLAAFRRFPAAPSGPLAEDREEIVRFVAQASLGTGILSVRGWVAPLLLGLVRDPAQVGFFRAAQAPLQGLGALSSPARLILLTEGTRDWERGDPESVLAGLRRYIVGSALLMALLLLPALWLMPTLIRVVLGSDYLGATDAARVMLLAGALLLVFGWTKSLPVSIGRPGLRIVAHGIETAVLLPLLILFGRRWGATGAAGAVLCATVVFAAVWTVLLLRLRAQPLPQASAT